MPVPQNHHDQIKIRSKKASALLAAGIALSVALFIALVFAAVLVVIHNGQSQSDKSRAFSRNVSCQVIAATQSTNGDLLYTSALQHGDSKAAAENIRSMYELTLSRNIENRLGFTGQSLINRDGTLNCPAYVRLGGETP